MTSPLSLDNAVIVSSQYETRAGVAGAQFSAVLSQYATPLFAPWAIAEASARANLVASTATLSAHPTTSSRREGRHARG